MIFFFNMFFFLRCCNQLIFKHPCYSYFQIQVKFFRTLNPYLVWLTSKNMKHQEIYEKLSQSL